MTKLLIKPVQPVSASVVAVVHKPGGIFCLFVCCVFGSLITCLRVLTADMKTSHCETFHRVSGNLSSISDSLSVEDGTSASSSKHQCKMAVYNRSITQKVMDTLIACKEFVCYVLFFHQLPAPSVLWGRPRCGQYAGNPRVARLELTRENSAMPCHLRTI